MLLISPIHVKPNTTVNTTEGDKIVYFSNKVTFVYNPRLNKLWCSVHKHRFIDERCTNEIILQAGFTNKQHFLSFFQAGFKQHDLLMEFTCSILEFDNSNTFKLH